MNIHPTDILGVFLVTLDRINDSRGFFARAFCSEEFARYGLDARITQLNLAHNDKSGTLRGLHYQRPPYAEAKLVRCVRGAICDVVVDIRKDSPTYLQHLKFELTAENRIALYVPKMFAHGYQSLVDDTDVLYSTSAAYHPESEGGLNPLDSALNIQWPLNVRAMSEKDQGWESITATWNPLEG